MQLSIIAIGRMQRGPEQQLVDEYLKRLPWKSSVVEIEIKKQAANAEERKAREAERLLAAVPDGAALIVLDERGKALNSRAFAGKIDAWQATGYSNLAIIIGGADGLHENVYARADLKLAFGTLTWPHMLVRVLLAEQIYRAWSINAGHPYHRD
ncbi:23S rRNA (pseudouridine(1915)-N(3))-methyltransferase RlmH [Kordiimonas aestuarii]|uniref:23S rRNA (pseudouridine(1915)-N(3))-methyltransferase RlmH n=1 Tax=Kordiimonas aestuarii TaxID=1005925 RepID=UPI0021D32477|nr:23S rRNA (pseudouridine(1915)-N(3))-methyltransferase RlmH [Kordiimonas aestuarii]